MDSPCSEAHLAVGRLDRLPDLEAFTLAAKAPLWRVLRAARVGEEQTFLSLCAWGEAVHNFHVHTRAPVLRYSHRLDARTIRMTAIYRTPRFDVNPPAPDLYAEGGRGLWLMRIHARAEFCFNGDLLWLRLAVDRDGG